MALAAPSLEDLGIPHPHDGANGYPGQSDWIRACLKFKVVSILCGRDVGKTIMDDFLFLEEGRQIAGPYDYGYVAQGHPLAEKKFEKVLESFRPWITRSKNKGQDRWHEFRAFGVNHGARMHFWSGEEGALENVRGVRLNRLAVDEAGFVHRSVLQTCGPMMFSRRGRAVYKGTVKRGGCGWMWFKEEYERGVNGVEGYKSFNAPSECSPFNDVEDLQFRRRQWRNPKTPDEKTPEEREEFDGELISDIGACFKNLDACIILPVTRTQTDGLIVHEEPIPGELYVIGQDWGKKHDHSVSTVFSRKTQKMVAFRRESLGVDYNDQMRRLDTLHRAYNKAAIVADARDAGSYINERLKVEYGDYMKEIAFTREGPTGKGHHVARVKHLFDAAAWRLIKHPLVEEEFSLFQQTPIGEHSNGFYYEAPAGKHDDVVTSAIFASSMLQMAIPSAAVARPFPAALSPEWYLMRQRDRARSMRRRGAW